MSGIHRRTASRQDGSEVRQLDAVDRMVMLAKSILIGRKGRNMSKQDHDGEWQEHWLVVGDVSEKAIQAIESVGGSVLPLSARKFHYVKLYGVCLLHHPKDGDQGFGYHTDDGEQARKLYVCSADAHHDLYVYCEDGSNPQFESNVMQLRIATEEEWFSIADARNER